MEFPLAFPPAGISVWDCASIGSLAGENRDQFHALVDAMGKKSALAQGLSSVITDFARMTVSG